MKRMSMQRILFAAAAIGTLAIATPVLAADPTLDQVYEAVHAGRLGDAESMMAQVLRDHPDSARAHYVEAEIFAREGRSAQAQSELNRAEQIAPGLPFVKSESTEALRALIAGHGAAAAPAAAVSHGGGFGWGPVLLIGGAIVLVLLVLRSRRAATPVQYGGSPGYGPMGVGPAGPVGTPYPPSYGGGGLGSSIVGGLATGAAVGAGVVAGEALAHDLMGGHRSAQPDSWSNDAAPPAVAGNDIDDRDFGIQDSGSWDDGGGGGLGGGGGGSDDWS